MLSRKTAVIRRQVAHFWLRYKPPEIEIHRVNKITLYFLKGIKLANISMRYLVILANSIIFEG